MRVLWVSVVALGCVSGPPARHPMPTVRTLDPAVKVFASATDPAITEGETVLEIAPEVAYAQLADYTHWPSIFPDIYTVTITAQAGEDARVTFVGPDDHHDNLHFHNRASAN